MTRRNVVSIPAAYAVLLVVVAACGGSGNAGSTGSQTVAVTDTQPTGLRVVTDARLGDHLVDGNGRSLYEYVKDVPAPGGRAVSNCGADCLPIWPVFDLRGQSVEGIAAADLDEITRSDGVQQTTYKGFPLYYFAGDASAGDTAGENFGGLWYVGHDPAYTVTLLSKPSQSSRYLTDGAGRALYVFARDTAGTATSDPVTACIVDPCLASFPAFLASPVTLPSVLAASDFTVFKRPDGMQQSAYKGRPLYYFANDTAPGDTKAQGLNGVWQTVDPSTP